MSNILTGIQQALEVIRLETEKADWQLRLEILQLMLSTSESVVAGARKQAAPQVKQVKQTVPVPRTKWVKRYVDMPKADSGEKKKQAIYQTRQSGIFPVQSPTQYTPVQVVKETLSISYTLRSGNSCTIHISAGTK